jgi:hypothetical protein
MRLAVINFSGNVGKTTVARHLLAPRLPSAQVIAVESVNADDGQQQAMRGRQFGELQEYLQTANQVVVDVGASNVEDLLALMRRYRGSHEDFDCFVVPTVPARKQQQDTIATLAELARIGVEPERARLVFNQVDDDVEVAQAFDAVFAFVERSGMARIRLACRLGVNEVYERVKVSPVGLVELAADVTDYKALIAATEDPAERLRLAQRLGLTRLARGVLPELDACFAALELSACANRRSSAAASPA